MGSRNIFDENFSFFAPSPVTSASRSSNYSRFSISPNTSRSPSPQREYVGYNLNDSISRPLSQRDTRYDTHRPHRSHRSSINALTAQLQQHRIDADISIRNSPSVLTTPSDMSPDTDEGFFEAPDTPASTATDYSSDFDPIFWDLAMNESNTTSFPRPSLSLEAQALSSFTQRRRQRQALGRLQCLVKRTPDLAMLIEECHPSSLPLSQDQMMPGSRRSSTTSLAGYGSGRIEKERSGTALVRRSPKIRRKTTRS